MKNCNEVIRGLPEVIASPAPANSTEPLSGGFGSLHPPRPERYLREGCYLLTYWSYGSDVRRAPYGTMRVDHQLFGTIASGDLYNIDRHNRPSPGAGIPIFSIEDYRSYLRVTEILHGHTTADYFTLGFEEYMYNQAERSWVNLGAFSADMYWTPAPASFPSEDFYLRGRVRDGAGREVGRLTMGWLDTHFRKATLEMDRVARSPFPRNNGAGVSWETVFENIGWRINVIESEINLEEPSGAGWNLAELHASMLAERDLSNLDREWRYHLQCVRSIDLPVYGVMFDAGAGDPNYIPREGAAINSDPRLANRGEYAPFAGLTFGEAQPFYFRTAVHEIGHAMGLPHAGSGTSFMARTRDVAGYPGPMLDSIQWGFSSYDARRLKHWPDICVRPGGLPFSSCWEATPLSELNVIIVPGLVVAVRPLIEVVPIGAPVRVNLNLENTTNKPIEAPINLSLVGSNVTGWVETPCGARKAFKSLFTGMDWVGPTTKELAPGESISHDLTLLRGVDGPLFANSGLHKVVVKVEWENREDSYYVMGSCYVMITPPVDEAHAKVAMKLLTTPEVLSVLVLGGDHLKEGIEAIQLALKNKVLRPHYALIEAKRLGQRFFTRKPDIAGASQLIDKNTVLSASEASRLLEYIQKAEGEQAAPKEVLQLLKQKAKGAAMKEEAIQ